MVYKITFTREELEEKFSHLQKLNYNQFRWWRMYDVKKKPLAAYCSLRDRIANGDYDFSHYWYQAAWVEHDINDLAIKCKDDAGLFSEKVQVLSARRKRLYEDYEKDDPEFQSLMTELNGTTDPAKRSSMLKKAQRIISDDYVNGYLFELAFTTVANAKVRGLWKNAPTQATDLTGVSWAD